MEMIHSDRLIVSFPTLVTAQAGQMSFISMPLDNRVRFKFKAEWKIHELLVHFTLIYLCLENIIFWMNSEGLCYTEAGFMIFLV